LGISAACYWGHLYFIRSNLLPHPSATTNPALATEYRRIYTSANMVPAFLCQQAAQLVNPSGLGLHKRLRQLVEALLLRAERLRVNGRIDFCRSGG
jgi:hypothetical protein